MYNLKTTRKNPQHFLWHGLSTFFALHTRKPKFLWKHTVENLQRFQWNFTRTLTDNNFKRFSFCRYAEKRSRRHTGNPRPREAERPCCHTNPTAPVAISPWRTLRKLWTTAAHHQIPTDRTTIANPSCWLFTPSKYLQTYAPSSAAGEPSYPYLSHLILPHKSISPVNLSTP